MATSGANVTEGQWLGPPLTLERMQQTLKEFRARYPEPDFWIYGMEVGPFGGPVGVSRAEMGKLAAGGWIAPPDELGRWRWSNAAIEALRSAAIRTR